MASSEKVVYIALVGHPVLEVAAIITDHGRAIDLFHEFVNYFNGVLMESYYREQEPVTDSFGTRFEHAIGEDELDKVGLPLYQVQEKLRRFITAHGTNLTIIVNDLSLYHEMKLSFDVNRVWHTSNKIFKMLKELFYKKKSSLNEIAQGRRCIGHRSVYYQYGWKEPACAFMLAALMVQESN